MTDYKDVEVKQRNQDDTEYNHPAFGMISVSRVSGSRNLFGSETINHKSMVRVEISDAYMVRALSSDWYHSSGRQIEILMTEAQWATFVSSFNTTGVPCTKAWVRGEGYVPEIPEVVGKKVLYENELKGTIKSAEDAIKAAMSMIDDLKVSQKNKDELRSKLEKAKMEISSNTEFVFDSFGRYMEKRTEQAKVEVHAHINNVIVARGIESINDDKKLIGE